MTIPMLDFTAAACELAQAIYGARASAYRLPYEWRALDAAAKDVYVQEAAEILDAHRPSNVIARITPDAPYGERV